MASERVEQRGLARWWREGGAVYSFIVAATLLLVDVVWLGTVTLLHGWSGVDALFTLCGL